MDEFLLPKSGGERLTMPHYACIDIGTNTVLLLVARMDETGELEEVRQEQRFARLGEGLRKTGKIKDANAQKALDFVDEYATIAIEYDVEWIKIVGTAALREAENGQELCNRILQRAGLKVNLISGEEEARYAYLGALSNKTHLKGQNLVVDIGGGSTEFIWGEDGKFEEAISLPIGSAKLTEKFGLQDAVTAEIVEEAGAHFRSFLDDIKQRLPSGIDHMIGTAGTFTTLAAVQFQVEKYKRDVIDGSKLTAAQIEAILHRLAKLEAKDRLDLPGIDPGREDVILGGAVIAEEILRWFGMDEIIISDRGLRFGVVLEEVGG